VSRFETLMARDGHTFQVYIAPPAGRARGAVVVVQERFGLTANIRAAADRFAAAGYLAMAPALFDRIRRGLVLGYSLPELEQGRGYRAQIATAQATLDIGATAAVAAHVGKVGVVGYCWGARLAWAAAAQGSFAAAVCYYGPDIIHELPQVPSCPTLLHFGDQDRSIPPAVIEQLRAAYPQGTYELYAADHGFGNSDRVAVYNAAAADLALARTLAFLAQHVG
jgi:carboxymethylenebutenolidase